MKTIVNFICRSTGILLLFASTSLLAQKVHTITLRVNTSNLTSSTINRDSNFGQSSKIANKDFTITVKKGEVVRWVGISTTNPKDKVLIKSINYEGGARLFSKNVLNGTNGIVTATVGNGKNGDVLKYKVAFRVQKSSGANSNRVYLIDPKLRVGL